MEDNYKVKDDDATLNFGFDWGTWLQSGDTIASYVLTVPTGITKSLDSHTDTQVVFRLAGGTLGTTYAIKCKITTSLGLVDQRTMYVTIIER